MSDVDRQIAQLRQRFNEATDTNLPVGKLGKTTGELTEASRPGYIYVREYAGNGQFNLPQLLLNALPDGTHIYAGLDVEIGMRRGERAVIGKDHRAGGGSPALPPSPYTNQQSISTLLVKPTEPPSMSLQVLGGSFVINDVTYTAPTTDGSTDAPHVNLTSIEAGLAAGEHCYAVVYALADFSGYEVFSSTPKSALLPLDDADIDECHTLKTAGSMPLRAVEVSEGQAEFNNNNVYLLPAKDLRPLFTVPEWVAVPASAGATGIAGQKAYDSTHFYVCVATDTWVRCTLATW